MEERELRITYGMCFKIAGDIVAQQDLTGLTAQVIADEIGNLTTEVAQAAIEGQEDFVSNNKHLITETTRSNGRSKSYGRRDSSSRQSNRSSGSSGGSRPKDPEAPATGKQIGFAKRLWDEYNGDLDRLNFDRDSFEEMTMGEISEAIDTLMK